MDEDKVKKLINKNTKAIIAPHLIGNLVNWEKIYKMLKKNIIIIEDSADTLGATYKNKSSGKYTDISITSFYGSHIINCAGNGEWLALMTKTLYKS